MNIEEANNKNINKYNSLNDIYYIIESYAANIIEDFSSLNSHMKQMSSLFNKLNEVIKEYQTIISKTFRIFILILKKFLKIGVCHLENKVIILTRF